jgi:hypothetical protein
MDNENIALEDEALLPVVDDTEAQQDDVEDGAEQEQPEIDAGSFVFDGDAPADGGDIAAPESNVLRELRNRNREQARLIKGLQAAQAPKDDEIGPKPKLEDFGYDDEEWELAYQAWFRKHGELEAKREAEKAKVIASQNAWAQEVQQFEAKAAELAIPDFLDVVRDVADEFGDDVNGQNAKAILVQIGNPALLVALKNSPDKIAELVSLKDNLVKFTIAATRLSDRTKVMPKRNVPAPESVVRGNAPQAMSGDAQLERLRAEAEKTGDSTKVIAYRRSLRSVE